MIVDPPSRQERIIEAAKRMYEYRAKEPDVRKTWLEAFPRDRIVYAEMAEIAAAVFLGDE